MSIEEAVRTKHALEANIKGYLKLASILDNNELELGLARVADMMQSEEGLFEKEHYRLRGQILKAYFDLRSQHKCVQDVLGRKVSWRKLAIPIDHHPKMLAYDNHCKSIAATHTTKLSRMTPLKRFWAKFIGLVPNMPLAPNLSQTERLIHSVAIYQLLPNNVERPLNWSPTSDVILLLAQECS